MRTLIRSVFNDYVLLSKSLIYGGMKSDRTIAAKAIRGYIPKSAIAIFAAQNTSPTLLN